METTTADDKQKQDGHGKPTAKTKAIELLHQGVTDLMSSEGWRQALEMRSRLHSYSFFNVSLILAQKPDATLVAGFRRWLELGRYVRKGEKGIAILAPLLKKDKDKPNEMSLVGFRTAYVFDVSQTDGDELPLLPSPKLLEDDTSAIRHAISDLEAFAHGEGFTVSYDLSHPRALGAYRPTFKTIALKPEMPALQTLKTLVHELAHALLHDLDDERHSAELEAESAAFLVCHELGLDTSSYSFAYLAGWTESLEQLITAGERASRAADRILEVVEDACAHSPDPAKEVLGELST
jgi:antirestriction protein ArdC